MTKYLVEKPFGSTNKTSPQGNCPDTETIADRLGFVHGPIPQDYRDKIAECQTLYVLYKGIFQNEHLDRWARGAPEARAHVAFGALQKAYSTKVYHSENSSGLVVLSDTSFGSEKERYWQLSMLFFPKLAFEDPRILAESGTFSLDELLLTNLWPLLDGYTGSGEAMIEDRNHFIPAPIRLTISGEENEVLDSENVAEGLVSLFHDGEFERRYAQTVRQISTMHRKRRLLKEGNANR